MCLILFAYQSHPRYPLIVAANRDEFYSRPTQKAHWWPSDPEILAGKDLQAGGTWLGISRNGRFAAVTNVREPHLPQIKTTSRGQLPQAYLTNRQTDQQFSLSLERSPHDYSGYNLLYGTARQLYYYSNRQQSALRLKPGIYGLSNSKLDTPWPKVEKGKILLQHQLKQELSTDQLLELLADNEIFSDEQLPQTGVSLEWERRLSAINISSPEYGTRSSTALLIDQQSRVYFHEKSHATELAEVNIQFQISNENGQL